MALALHHFLNYVRGGMANYFSAPVFLTISSVVGGAATSYNANPQLCGVNNEWINPLNGMFIWDTAGWKLEEWVNQSDPFASPKLHQLLSGLSLGSYRYPGGSIGNYWDWKRDTLSPQANSEYYQTIANLSAKFFPPHAFGFAKFDKMLVQASPHGNTASNILTLDVSTAGPDASVPAMVVEALGLSRANKFEIGNEVYDPRQGPPPNGYRTAQEYLESTASLVRAVRATGARAGVTLAPCPFFWPASGKCWGGSNGRYHQWNSNISASCSGATSTSTSSCPFDAVIAHNYVMDLSILAPFAPAQFMSLYLAVPQITVDNGVASLRRDFPPEVKLWLTEYNTFYPNVWNGNGDASHREAAKFLNSTENSGAHAVHVAAYLMAAMVHGDAVEVMNYHSFLEGAAPQMFGPNGVGDKQPGFAVSAINTTGIYVSPVAQFLSMFSRWLSEPNSTVDGVSPQPAGAPALNFTLAAVNLGGGRIPCVQAAVVCSGSGGSSRGSGGSGGSGGDGVRGRVLVINRCAMAVPAYLPPPTSTCSAQHQQRSSSSTNRGSGTPNHSTWSWRSVLVFRASTGLPGKTWIKGGENNLPWEVIKPEVHGNGSGMQLEVEPFALSIIELE